MSTLAIYEKSDRVAPREVIRDHAEISARLKTLGVRFERWETNQPLSADAGQEEVLAAYAKQVGKLNEEYGFQSVDVVSLRPDHPKKDELRAKFLEEHIHKDFEVRFFVDGSGLFYLNVGDTVYGLLCEQGDLVSVPAGTLHWYDMGAQADFKCIRLFVVPDGWVAEFSGSGMAECFPKFEQFVENFA
ncbi:MAG: cupin [Gammaproteobacteria bacterium]|nr:cupin [Gammaproteobacteria bacterium]